MSQHDVVVVGAGIAGCTAAALFARRGARVALIERHSDSGAYKTVCTHFIQPSATPTLERLGAVDRIEAAGGVRNGMEIWTRWGWIRPEHERSPHHVGHGWSIRREKLDPMLRELAAEEPNVELMLGQSVVGLIGNGRPHAVEVEDRDGIRRRLDARLVVGADGRDSRVGELAGVATKVKPHERFAYWAYYRDVPLASGSHSQMWLLDPDVAYAFPNDDGLTLLACFPHKGKLPEFKADLEGSFVRFMKSLPDGPPIERGERVSKVLGKLDLPNVYREPATPGLALAGDAALATDPLWGIGCGWALQSAEWLVDSAAAPLLQGGDLDRALRRYARRHRRRFGAHHFFVCDDATGRRLNPLERLFFSAATRDAELALHADAYGTRSISPWRFLTPRAMARAARVNLGAARAERAARRNSAGAAARS